jgi:hypothetical protein
MDRFHYPASDDEFADVAISYAKDRRAQTLIVQVVA